MILFPRLSRFVAVVSFVVFGVVMCHMRLWPDGDFTIATGFILTPTHTIIRANPPLSLSDQKRWWIQDHPNSRLATSSSLRQVTAIQIGADDDNHNDDDEDYDVLDHILKVAIDASEKACDVIRKHTDGSDVVSTKSTGRDLLTMVDPLCEQIIRDTILESFPNHYILGEESVEPGIIASQQALGDAIIATTVTKPNTATTPPADDVYQDDGWLWIIDPIDGTTNFASGIPLSMPIIAVAYHGEVIAGVLNDPHSDELYTAIKGRGAYCNGKKVQIHSNGSSSGRNTDTTMSLSDAVIGMESPAGEESLRAAVRGIQLLMPNVRTIRMLGSTAVFMPWVANGRLSAYWTPDECVWDIAAGALLVQEAGGIVSDAKGDPYTLRTRSLVASCNDIVHNEILKILKESNAYVEA